MVWRLYGSEAASLGGLRTLVLQTAHPFIAHAVQQKSAYRTDTRGRNERTFRAIVNWAYGDLERVLTSARTVFRVHSHINGEIANRVGPYDVGDTYAATEQRSLFWVHATGVYNSWQMHERVYGPLTREERNQYNEESKLFALIFGIDEALLPPTFDDFLEYWDSMIESDVLTPDQASRDIARYVMAPPTRELSRVWDWLKIITAGLLPPRIRHGYELKWGRFEQHTFDVSMKAVRTILPRLPAEFRQTFYYRRAMHRALETTPGCSNVASIAPSSARSPGHRARAGRKRTPKKGPEAARSAA